MFTYSDGITTIPLLDTSNVITMDSMFFGCKNLQSIPLLNTSKVTNMNYMFEDCDSLTTIPLLDTSNVKSMHHMFYGCKNLQTIPQLDTSGVKRFGNMFYGCPSIKSLPLIDCGNATEMTYFLTFAENENCTDLGGFKNLKISMNGYFVNSCPNLTIDSLMNVINNLWDWSGNTDGKAPLNDGTIYNFGTTHTLSFGQTNLGKLTEEQIAIATAKGWTLTA